MGLLSAKHLLSRRERVRGLLFSLQKWTIRARGEGAPLLALEILQANNSLVDASLRVLPDVVLGRALEGALAVGLRPRRGRLLRGVPQVHFVQTLDGLRPCLLQGEKLVQLVRVLLL